MKIQSFVDQFADHQRFVQDDAVIQFVPHEIGADGRKVCFITRPVVLAIIAATRTAGNGPV
ncbi:hypothetical protein B9057_12375 [Aestuarium zhoushanense]|nr:hypothetical protein B9057_12375 [Aestuarium zhoushanense]